MSDEKLRAERDTLAKALAAATEQCAKLMARYVWAANELLACDYGDNEAPGEQVGWRVYGWRNRGDVRRIFGPSIDVAIDTELDRAQGSALCGQAMRVEAHQRRIRKAVERLNVALAAAKADNIYASFWPIASENNDHEFQELRITSWSVEEPKAKPAVKNSEGE